MDIRTLLNGGDNATALAEMFPNCDKMAYDDRVESLLLEMIQLDRPASFEYFFPHVSFTFVKSKRDSQLTALLRVALSFHNIPLADKLLEKDFRLADRKMTLPFWVPTGEAGCRDQDYKQASLEEHTAFIDRHRQRFDLSPTWADLQAVTDAKEAILLLKLAQYCARQTFGGYNPTKFFQHGLALNHCLSDEDMTEAVKIVLIQGASHKDVLRTLADDSRHKATYQALKAKSG
jgi:hypothetical protein